MRKSLVGLLILSSLGWAQPARKLAMVLRVQGSATNGSLPVVTGQLWAAGDSIQLAPESQVTVLLLNQGERQEISGQGSLDVAADGLKLHGGCRSRLLSSGQPRLALTGDNHRQIAGMVLRGAASVVENSPFSRIEVLPQSIKLSRLAESGSPPPLRFVYLSRYSNPILGFDLQSVKMPTPARPSDALFSPEIKATRQGELWVWESPWPLEGPNVQALEVVEPGTERRQLYTRIYRCSPQEQSELAAARARVTEWARQDPESIEPSVYLANLLEDKGQLEAALEALKPALALQLEDEGLVQMHARLLIDLGRYQDAAEVLTEASQ
ncbi:hypothetical protein JST97_05940 [bacterium]|nr:hypothetical protein [bacterium]